MCSPKLLTLTLISGLLLADQVTLVNGDKVTGTIVKKDGDSLSIKSALMGDITLKWKDVASVSAEKPLTVVLEDGQTVRGPLAAQPEKLVVASEGQPVEVPLTTVKVLRNSDEQARYERYLHPPITDLWVGYFDIGVASAQGNARTLVFTTAMNANRATQSDRTSVYFNQIYSRAVVEDRMQLTAKAIRGGWAYNRNLHPRLFINGFNDYENDAFQNLKLRFVAGSGLGLKVIRRERTQFDLLSGIAYNREQYTRPLNGGPKDTRNSAEGYWGDDLLFKVSSISSLKQSFRMFNNVSNPGEYRVNFDLGFDTRLFKWLSWQATFSDRFLTNPVPGRKTNDLLLSSGIRLSFSRVPK